MLKCVIKTDLLAQLDKVKDELQDLWQTKSVRQIK